MGNRKSAVKKQKFMSGIEQNYKLTPYEAQLLVSYFGANAKKDKELSFREFVLLFGYLNPNFRGPFITDYAEKIYYRANHNHNGTITYDYFNF